MRRAVLVLSFALLLAAGCAGTPVREEAVAPAPGDTVVDIRAASYSFTPSNITVPAGKPLVFRIRNDSGLIPHSFVLASPQGTVIVDRDLVKNGETLVRVPPLSPGIYPFYCDETILGKSHRSLGMEGKIEAKGEN